VNFTREPIIETIISPKDGYKLCVRNSRGSSVEEYFVDAIEVVSFGRAFFFRSLERPKAFLVPVTDYEVVEVKETRVALKNVSHERNIKIGGGREAPIKHVREHVSEEAEESIESSDESITEHVQDASVESSSEARGDKRRDRRRHRRRRLAEERREWVEKEKQDGSDQSAPKDEIESSEDIVSSEDNAKVSTSMFSTLFPPPPTLISDTIARYKEKEGLEGAFFSKAPKEDLLTEDEVDHSDSTEIQHDKSDTSFPSDVNSDETT
jgi:hypothetical protein